MSKKLLAGLLTPLLVYLLLFPEDAVSASARGVDLWFHTVLPTLLPFIILTGLLVRSGILLPLLRKAGRLFRIFPGLSGPGTYILILGLACGYPMGARLTASLFESGEISREEACFLLRVSNHVSPMFLRGYVLRSLPEQVPAAAVACLYYTAAAAAFFLYRPRKRQIAAPEKGIKKEMPCRLSVGELLDTSIMDGFDVIVRLGGYIILFTVYAELLKSLTSGIPFFPPVLSMILEISSGTAVLLEAPLALPLKTAFLLFGLSLGGISTAAQTAGMIRGSGLSIRTYLKAKMLQASLAFCMTLFFFAVV